MRPVPSLLLVLACLLGPAARAEDEKARKVREELEKQLSQLVGEVPSRVRIDFEALDEPGYTLKEAAFELDGAPLPAPALSTLAREGQHPVWSGEVRPGTHNVRARITYLNPASIVVSDEGGYAWKLSGDVSFPVQKGLEVQVRVVPQRDGSQRQLAKRMRLSLPATPVMVARLDDGVMPEPARPAPVAAASAAPAGEPAPAEAADLPSVTGERLPSRAGTPSRRRPASAKAPGPSQEPPSGGAAPEAVPAEAPSPAVPPARVAAADPALLPATRPPPDAPTEPVEASGDEVPWPFLGGAAVVLVVAVALGLWARRRAVPPTFRDP